MKFSDITTAIHDAWRFCWPPIVACAITYVVGTIVYPSGVRSFTTNTGTAMSQAGASLMEFRGVMEPFGLTKLVPFVSLILVIAILYVVNNVALHWCSKLPPYVSYQPDQLLFERIPKKEKLLLLRKYQTAEHFNAAYYFAVQELRASRKAAGRMSRAENYYKFHNFTKFAAGVAVATLIIAIASSDNHMLPLLGRALAVISVAAVLWAGALVGLLYEQEQEFADEWTHVRYALQAEAAKLLEAPIAGEEEERLIQEEEQSKSYRKVRRWWRIYLFDPYKIQWFKRTFYRLG